jgi:hypothetical protein
MPLRTPSITFFIFFLLLLPFGRRLLVPPKKSAAKETRVPQSISIFRLGIRPRRRRK